MPRPIRPPRSEVDDVIDKIDRLTRSLADFSKMVEVFERYGVSFVSVTQQFNTTTSMGRLMLNTPPKLRNCSILFAGTRRSSK